MDGVNWNGEARGIQSTRDAKEKGVRQGRES